MEKVKVLNLELTIKLCGNAPNIDRIELFHENQRIAYLTIKRPENSNNIYAFDTFVHKEYRRKRIATFMYKKSEELSLKKILPYEYLEPNAQTSSDAIEFWRQRGLNLNDRNRLFD